MSGDSPAFSIEALSIAETRAGVAFWIHVTPGARKPRIGGTHGDALRVAVASQPVAGRANAACVLALARALGEPSAAVHIPPSSKGRRKRVEVEGETSSLRDKLLALACA